MKSTILVLAGAFFSLAAIAQEPAPVNLRKPRMVLVHPRRFAEALAPYVAWRNKVFEIEDAVLEDVLEKSEGVDDAEKLKRHLYHAWHERGVRYALLVGDAHILPVRYMALDRCTKEAFDYAFYPSDLYYSDLARKDGSFEDWNGSKDGFHAGYFGEVRGEKNKGDPINFDAIDYRPDIAVGRWPVGTDEEVGNAIAKTVAYETAVHGTPDLLRRVGILCVAGWIDARKRLDGLALSLPPGWKVEKRYFGDSKAPDAPPPPDEAEAVRLLNEGTGFLFHTGHGNDDRWEGSLSLGSIKKLKNAGAPAILMSIGCSTARFATLPPYEAYVDAAGVEHKGTNAGEVFEVPPPPPAPYQTGRFNPTGFGEQLVRRGATGAAAYIGCNTGGQPCALTLLEAFAESLKDRAACPRLGDAYARAVSLYFDREHLDTLAPDAGWYPPSIFFQAMKYMLFGDPTLALPLP